MNTNILRLGIVGCGAVTETFYLPAIKRLKHSKLTVLVDKNLDRARKLKTKLGKDIFITNDYEKIAPEIDMVIVALPHFLHAPVTISFLSKKIHVLCEKPMAINLTEAKEMIQYADKNNVKLAIGMMRRQFSITKKIKEIIESDYLGKITTFDYEEGFPYDWPVQSKFIFDKNQAGGGVLIDMGAHVVDLLVYLFSQLGKPEITDYRDDNHGGVEANCIFNMRISKMNGRVELSNDRRLRNTFIITFTKGKLELPSGGVQNLSISKNNNEEIFTTEETYIDAFYKQLEDFVNAITSGTGDFVSGKEVLSSMNLIDYCYKNKKQLYEPWYTI